MQQLESSEQMRKENEEKYVCVCVCVCMYVYMSCRRVQMCWTNTTLLVN